MTRRSRLPLVTIIFIIFSSQSPAQISTELKVGIVFTSQAISAGGSAATQFAGIRLYWNETFENSGMTPPLLELYDGPAIGQVGSTAEYLVSLPSKNPGVREWRDSNNVDLILLVVPSLAKVVDDACGYVLGMPDDLPGTLDYIINSASWLSVFAQADNRYVGVVSNNQCPFDTGFIATHEAGHLFYGDHELCYPGHPDGCNSPTDETIDEPAPYNHAFGDGNLLTVLHNPVGSHDKVFSGKDNVFPTTIAPAGNSATSDNKRVFTESTFPYTALFRPKAFSLQPAPTPPTCYWEFVGCSGGLKQFLISWSGGGEEGGGVVEYIAEKSTDGNRWFPGYSGRTGCVPQVVSSRIFYRIFGITQSGGYTSYCQVTIRGGQCDDINAW